jgi:hypothetical protein
VLEDEGTWGLKYLSSELLADICCCDGGFIFYNFERIFYSLRTSASKGVSKENEDRARGGSA